jgi:hypothetical protein
MNNDVYGSTTWEATGDTKAFIRFLDQDDAEIVVKKGTKLYSCANPTFCHSIGFKMIPIEFKINWNPGGGFALRPAKEFPSGDNSGVIFVYRSGWKNIVKMDESSVSIFDLN